MDILTRAGCIAALRAARARFIGVASETTAGRECESQSGRPAPLHANQHAVDDLLTAIPYTQGELDGEPCRVIDLDALKAVNLNSKLSSERLRAHILAERAAGGH